MCFSRLFSFGFDRALSALLARAHCWVSWFGTRQISLEEIG
jgi:hypothetical protein